MSLDRELAVMAKRAAITPGSISWEEVRAAVNRHAKRQGEWAGMPIPVKGMRMIIAEGYPFRESMAETFMPEPFVHKCRNSDVDETTSLRNEWHSYRDGKLLSIWHDSKGYFFTHGRRQNCGTMLIDTIGAARSWDFEAELRAQETLKRHLTEWAYQCYIMTGSFLETSPRSHITYVFRRLRPTLALTARPNRHGKDVGMRFLASLCLHPVGFWDGTWAGCLTATDDVLSHLLLMRGCEAKFWARANQHEVYEPEAGVGA